MRLSGHYVGLPVWKEVRWVAASLRSPQPIPRIIQGHRHSSHSLNFVRMEAQCARFEAGQVYLPREAPWLSDCLHAMYISDEGKKIGSSILRAEERLRFKLRFFASLF
jgi:hypothetical protein